MKIRPRGGTYQLDLGMVEGQRKVLSFKTLELAEAEYSRRLELKEKLGLAGFALTPDEILGFVHLKRAMEDAGKTMPDLMGWLKGGVAAKLAPIPMTQLVQKCVAAKKVLNKRATYTNQIEIIGNAFARAFDDRLCHEYTPADVERYLRQPRIIQGDELVPWSPITQNGQLRTLQVIFRWAEKEGYVTKNPCKGIPLVERDESTIEFLSLGQAKKLLKRTAAIDEPLLAYVVIGLFCGVRSEELLGMGGRLQVAKYLPEFVATARIDGKKVSRKRAWELAAEGALEWDQFLAAQKVKEMSLRDVIDLDASEVVVPAGVAKGRARRVVDLPDCAVAWLQAYPRAGERGWWRNFTKRWRAVREGVSFSKNALRHTFASMHYAHFRDEKKLQVLMGHRDAEVLHRHYRGLVRDKETAKAFWELRPEA